MERTSLAPPLTDSTQDYLKGIYELTRAGKAASTGAIAARLGHSAASVTGMLQKLAAQKPPLITYRKHHGAELTESGERAALEVIRHHRLLETWLVQVLGYSWADVHGEAEKLEHVMSEDLERRISRALGNPARDPHGEPIPSASLVMPSEHSVPLAQLKVGQEAVVRRVQPGDAAALRHLNGLGILIGAPFRVMSVSAYDNVMTIQIPGQDRSITLGPALMELVFVERRTSHKKASKETS